MFSRISSHRPNGIVHLAYQHMTPAPPHGRRILVLSTSLAVCLAASPAAAAGFLTSQFGSDHGAPALANPYDVYFNPAAMAGASGSQIVVDGVLAVHWATYDRSASALSPSVPGGVNNQAYREANTGTATLFNVLGAPYIGFTTDFGGTPLRLGVASYVPFGGVVQWDKNAAYRNASATGAYDGPQRWQAISTSTASFYETAALAYRFEALRVGVGASVSVIRTGVTDVRARNGNGTDDVFGPNGGSAEGRSELDVHGVEVGAAVGLYWEPLANGQLRLGASYTSQPGFGTMRLNGTFREQLGGQTNLTPPGPADFLQAYPDVVRAGAAWRVRPELELRADAALELWSRFTNQCVVKSGAACEVDASGASTTGKVIVNFPREWRDTIRVRAGGSYWVVPASELFASVAYESPPVGQATVDALLYESTRLYATVGVRQAFTQAFAGSLGATYIQALPSTVNDSSFFRHVQPSRWPSANGRYTSEILVLDAAVSYAF
ncbi:MAG: outer membrane protein transport protein [Myxococcota bacterium]|nr:outer membrane protein transport protein [Myxococcota bacterium]